jgi:hypothetical protein
MRIYNSVTLTATLTIGFEDPDLYKNVELNMFLRVGSHCCDIPPEEVRPGDSAR